MVSETYIKEALNDAYLEAIHVQSINIIIPVLGSRTWTGGFTYQANLIEAFDTWYKCVSGKNLDQVVETNESIQLPVKFLQFISQIKRISKQIFTRFFRGYNKELTQN